MTNSIRDILQNFEQQVVTGHGGATLKHHAEAEQAINAYILGEVMELLKLLCEDDKIKVWNYIEKYKDTKDYTK